MRLVYKKYADGTYKVYTTDEKGQNEKILEGDVPQDHKVHRVPMFIEVNGENVQDALDGLSRLTKNLQKSA